MSEEIRNASTIVPYSLLTSIMLNGILGFGMLIAVLFFLGDISAALGTPTGYPFMEIFMQATNSTAGSTAMITIVTVLQICATIACLAGSSRMTWSFARDHGLPGWRVLSKVPHPFRSRDNHLLIPGALGQPSHLDPYYCRRLHHRNRVSPWPHQHRVLDRFQRRHFPDGWGTLHLVPDLLHPPPLAAYHRGHRGGLRRKQSPRHDGTERAVDLGSIQSSRETRHRSQPLWHRVHDRDLVFQLLAACDPDHGADDEL